MKKLFLLFVVLLLLPRVYAQDADEAGITPDSPFYGLDKALERITLALSAGRAGKAEARLKMASERIAELVAMVDKGKPEFVDELVNEHKKEMDLAEDDINAAKDSGKDVVALQERLAEVTYKHVLVLEIVLEKVPDQARDAITKAIEVSQKGNQRALSNIERETGKAADPGVDLAQRPKGRR